MFVFTGQSIASVTHQSGSLALKYIPSCITRRSVSVAVNVSYNVPMRPLEGGFKRHRAIIPRLQYREFRAPRKVAQVQSDSVENYGPNRKSSQSNKIRASPKGPDQFRDEHINYGTVCVIEAAGVLSEPISLDEALRMRRLDKDGRLLESLRQVADPTSKLAHPVCRFVDLQQEQAEEWARNKAVKSAKSAQKQLELGWTMSDHDLGHRMSKLQGFLLKGLRVEIILGSTKRKGWMKRRAEDDQSARKMLEKIYQAVKDIPGAAEAMAPDGKLGAQLILTFQGKKSNQAQHVEGDENTVKLKDDDNMEKSPVR